MNTEKRILLTKLLFPLSIIAMLLFDGTGSGDGGGDGGDGGSSGSGDKTPPATGSAGGSGSGKPAEKPDAAAGGGTEGGEQTVPYSRFKEINDELQRRKNEDQARADEEATKKGEFDTVKKRLEGENGGLKETLTAVARRNAFYAEANGKASNLRLAYIAAGELGLLDDLKVEINTEKKTAEASGDVKSIVDAVLKANPELKTRSSSFGEPNGDTPPGDGADVSKKTALEKIEAGYSQRQAARTR